MTQREQASPDDGRAARRRARLGPDVIVLRERLDELRARLRHERRRARAAEARAEQAERRLQAYAGVDDAEARAPDGSRRAGPPADPTPARPPLPARPIDLNAARFELLRALGMSITQSRRFIAHREQVGGLSSLDDLDDVIGLSRELKEHLRRNCVV